MAAFNQVLTNGVHVVARAVVRQVTSESQVPPTTGVTSAPSSTPTLSATFTTSVASNTPSPTPPATDQNQGNNSPLLFFVALGFGVVFTNLW